MKIFHLAVDKIIRSVIQYRRFQDSTESTDQRNDKTLKAMNGELTQLGKFLRKLRIDHNELLRDMSDKLGVAMSFLSSVENGKKSMPSEWISKIPDLYSFTDAQKSEFDAAVAASEKGVGVKFSGLSDENKKLSVAFARKISTLSPKERQALQALLF